MPQSFPDQITEAVKRVRKAHREAMAETQDGVLTGFFKRAVGANQKQNARNTLKSLGRQIDRWAERAEAARQAQRSPDKGGWSGWFRGGEIIIVQLRDIGKLGSDATLSDLKRTVADAKRDARNMGKAAAKITTQATGTVLGVGFELVKPFVPILLIGVAVAVGARVIAKRATGG